MYVRSMYLWVYVHICTSSGVSKISFRGGVQNLLGGFGGMLPRKFFKKWCNLVRFREKIFNPLEKMSTPPEKNVNLASLIIPNLTQKISTRTPKNCQPLPKKCHLYRKNLTPPDSTLSPEYFSSPPKISQLPPPRKFLKPPGKFLNPSHSKKYQPQKYKKIL